CLQEQLSLIETKIKSLNIGYSDQRHSILSLHQSLLDFINVSSKKSDFENFKNEVYEKIKDSLQTQNRSLQSYQKDMNYMLKSIQEEQANIRLDMENKFNEFEKRMNDKYCLYKMDKEHILKEIRVY